MTVKGPEAERVRAGGSRSGAALSNLILLFAALLLSLLLAEVTLRVVGAAPVMRLARCDLQADRQPRRINKRVDLGRQPAS